MKAKRKPLLRFHVLPCDELHHHIRDTCPCRPALEKLVEEHGSYSLLKGIIVTHNAEPDYPGMWVTLTHDESTEI